MGAGRCDLVAAAGLPVLGCRCWADAMGIEQAPPPQAEADGGATSLHQPPTFNSKQLSDARGISKLVNELHVSPRPEAPVASPYGPTSSDLTATRAP